jgi:hypothetical protein
MVFDPITVIYGSVVGLSLGLTGGGGSILAIPILGLRPWDTDVSGGGDFAFDKHDFYTCFFTIGCFKVIFFARRFNG